MIIDLISATQRADWPESRRVLYRHWIHTSPIVFAPNPDQPWDASVYNEKNISSEMFTPLVGAFSLEPENIDPTLAPMNALTGLDPENDRKNICGHVFKVGELTYSCQECRADSTCVMCRNCFESSIHMKHKFNMHASGGSGYCDCGDADAWSDGHACEYHTPIDDDQPMMALAPEISLRLHKLTEMVIQYAVSLITYKDEMKLPPFLDQFKGINSSKDVPLSQQHLTVFYNDETHTYENVIRVLELCLHLTKDQAMLVATIVDREGRCGVRMGNKTDCIKWKEDAQRRSQRSTDTIRRGSERPQPLEVKVMDTMLYSNQNHAIALLNWLASQVDVYEPLREIVGEILLNCNIERAPERAPERAKPQKEERVELDDLFAMPEGVDLVKRVEEATPATIEDSPMTLVETLIREDAKMWKSARAVIHNLILKTLMMNIDQKLTFSKLFMKNYDHLYEHFIADDHDMDISVISLTVQFLSVTSVARCLMAESDAFATVMRSLLLHTKKYLKHSKKEELGPGVVLLYQSPSVTTTEQPERFDFTGRAFPSQLRRALHIGKDLSYILSPVPTRIDWTDELRNGFCNGFSEFLRFLHRIEGMDEVKRQATDHQVWESEWETAFNIQLRMKELLYLVVAWAQSDEKVFVRVLNQCLDAMRMHPLSVTEENGESHVVVRYESEEIPIKSFDVTRGAVSIHHPIARLTAALFASPHYVAFLAPGAGQPEDKVRNDIKRKLEELAPDMYEFSLRTLVLCAQSSANLWRRNGFSLINQLHNYISPLCRGEMFDRDLLMMQVGAAVNDPTKFIIHVLHRFRVADWARQGYDGPVRSGPFARVEAEEGSKIIVTLAEECLHLLILIIGERYMPGVSEEVSVMDYMKREVIHALCTNSQAYSFLSQRLTHDVHTEKVSLREAVAAVANFRKPASTSAGQFYLKEEFFSHYNQFYYHYSKSEQSLAERSQQKLRLKMEKSIRACPPPMPPSFSPFFTKIPNLLKNTVLLRTMKNVLERTAKRNRFSSDRLFQRVLFLIGMGLNEQKKDASFAFTTTAEDDCSLLSAMTALQGTTEAAAYDVLLDYTVETYKKLHQATLGHEEKMAEEKSSNVDQESDEARKAKRAEMAARMRAQALKKMTSMQSKFMKKVEDDEPIVDATPTTPTAKRDEYAYEDVFKQVPTDGQQFPVCLGPQRWTVEVERERMLQCILCQEENPASGKPMVSAAFIQQSQLFAKKTKDGSKLAASGGLTKDQMVAAATLRNGIDVSTCSHTMHYDCYKQLSDNLKSKDVLRARPAYNPKIIDPDIGEYACPLCKRFSNAAIPLLPVRQLTTIEGFSTVSSASKESFADWLTRIKRNLDMPFTATEQMRKKGHCRKRSHSERSLVELGKQASSQSKDIDAAHSVSPSGEMFDSTLVSESILKDSTAGASSQITTATPPQVLEEETQEFFNELAMMLNPVESQLTSPIHTPETTPTYVSSPSSDSTMPVTDGPNADQQHHRHENLLLGKKATLPSQIQHVLFNIIRPVPFLINSTHLVGPAYEAHEEAVKELGKSMIKSRRRSADKNWFLEKHLRGYVTAMVTWQSTAHVARAIASFLQHDGKPLFGALNTRQKDCLTALARLSMAISYNLQFLPNAVADMIRILCCDPPKAKEPMQSPVGSPPHTNHTAMSPPTYPTSPMSTGSPSAAPGTSTIGTQTNPLPAAAPANTQPPSTFAFVIQLFSPAGTKKQANSNILHVDILSLALSLMMSIGWTWQNGVQSMHASSSIPAAKQTRQLAPDGSTDEAYVLQLSLIAHYFQIMATYREEDEEEDTPMMDEEESDELESTFDLLKRLWTRTRPNEQPLNTPFRLYQRLLEGANLLLRPIALIYHNLTMVDPPEALKDPSINTLEPLLRYLGLPMKLEQHLGGAVAENLFLMWSAAIPRDEQARNELVVQPVQPNLLINLPHKYSDIIHMAADFRCPSIAIDDSSANVPTICLVCGQILCSQGYCCQKIVNKETFGACRCHMGECSGSVGVFLRVRECSVILMTTRKRGCFRPAPYVDEFGEVDQGFRRFNPLFLNEDMYQKLKMIWLQQGITEEVVHHNELNHTNQQFDWAHF